MVNLPIEYSDKPVTPFGGLALMKRFVDQTGIREHLATLELPQGNSNRAYDPVHIIEGFWLGIWTGASRYIHCDWLRQDETLAAIFDLWLRAPAEPKHLQPVQDEIYTNNLAHRTLRNIVYFDGHVEAVKVTATDNFSTATYGK
jgi:prepilin-type processing-associated H-X9-DG protein